VGKWERLDGEKAETNKEQSVENAQASDLNGVSSFHGIDGHDEHEKVGDGEDSEAANKPKNAGRSAS